MHTPSARRRGVRHAGRHADELRYDEVARHVERSAAHVEQPIDAEDDADAFGRNADLHVTAIGGGTLRDLGWRQARS